jgi:hypothetical protein
MVHAVQSIKADVFKNGADWPVQKRMMVLKLEQYECAAHTGAINTSLYAPIGAS